MIWLDGKTTNLHNYLNVMWGSVLMDGLESGGDSLYEDVNSQG